MVSVWVLLTVAALGVAGGILAVVVVGLIHTNRKAVESLESLASRSMDAQSKMVGALVAIRTDAGAHAYASSMAHYNTSMTRTAVRAADLDRLADDAPGDVDPVNVLDVEAFGGIPTGGFGVPNSVIPAGVNQYA